jgi:uncharacterized protein
MSFSHPALDAWYDAVPRDYERMRELLHPEVEFHVCEGWPNGGTYLGREGVLDDFFPRASGAWESLVPEIDEVVELGETCVVRGRYVGIAVGGHNFTVQYVHVWRLRDGKLASLHQVADSALLADAIAGREPTGVSVS